MAGPNMLPVHRVQRAVPPLQVSGCKYFQLYPPEATPLLYPHTDGLTTNSSRVDARNPDPAAFPLFARARGHQCIISRGEALYLPPGAYPPSPAETDTTLCRWSRVFKRKMTACFLGICAWGSCVPVWVG